MNAAEPPGGGAASIQSIDIAFFFYDNYNDYG